jgi:hypothetical protein
LSVNQSSFSKVMGRVTILKAEPPNKNEIITRIAKIVRRGSGLEKPQAATGLQFSKKLSHRQQGVKKRG